MCFKVSLKFPPSYPYSPPTVKFETPCFHPNVDQNGNICLDILKVRKAIGLFIAFSVVTLNRKNGRLFIMSRQSCYLYRVFWEKPNVDSPLNSGAASLWQNQEGMSDFSQLTVAIF